jgi:hypothetical protein
VAAGALLSLKTRSFKPVLFAMGGPITGVIGACCLTWTYYTKPS